jgi:RecA-family ATPase
MSRKLVMPRKMDMLKALSTSPPVPDHVLPGLPTGSVGALIASGGAGKTLLLLQTSIALATGQPALGGLFGADVRTQAPAKVVLVVAEESVDVMHLRLHVVLGKLLSQTRPLLDQDARDSLFALLHANLDLYPLAGSTRLLIDGRDTTGDGLETLRAMSAGARLLVIDPLRQFHTGDENDSWAMTSVVQGLQGIASAHQCAVLVAHHTNKSSTFNGQGDRAGAARGSAALTDGVRMQLNLWRYAR